MQNNIFYTIVKVVELIGDLFKKFSVLSMKRKVTIKDYSLLHKNVPIFEEVHKI